MKKLTLDLPEELIADLGYVKIYLNGLSELLRKYPHSISGDQQRFYINRSTELINKTSCGIGSALKLKRQESK